jgi:hypothetical protein
MVIEKPASPLVRGPTLESSVKFYRPAGSAVAGFNEMDRSIFKLVPWDVWAALAVAVMVLILAAYDHSPLLIVVLAATAVYITIQNRPYDRYRS